MLNRYSLFWEDSSVPLTKEDLKLAKKIRLYKKPFVGEDQVNERDGAGVGTRSQTIPRLSRGGEAIVYQFLRRGERTGMKIANYSCRRIKKKGERVVHKHGFCKGCTKRIFLKLNRVDGIRSGENGADRSPIDTRSEFWGGSNETGYR